MCLTLATSVAGAARVAVDQLYVNDSDGMWQYRLLAGSEHRVDTPLTGSSAGFRAGRWRIDDSAGREDFNMLRIYYDSGDTRSWRARAGLVQLFGEGSPTLADAILNWSNDRWYVEGGAQRELIDTVTAVRLHNLVDTWSISADYRIASEWTAVGALYTQSISDGNHRFGQVARLVYSPERYEGLTLQGRVRHVDSDFNGIGYFSPDRLLESMLLAGYRRPLFDDNWVAGAQAGIGRQTIDSEIHHTLYLAELSLRGWFTERLGLDGRAMCSNAGGSATGQGDSGYRYCAVNLTLIGAW